MVSNNAWLMLAKEERQHGGNLGYDDLITDYYSWDDTVSNFSKPQAGDKIVIWDGDVLLGAGTIEEISEGTAEKTRQRCPNCKTTKIKARKRNTPTFRCHQCGHEFQNAFKEQVRVRTYRSCHHKFWY